MLTQIPPARKRPRGWDRRRFLYVAGAAVAIIGIVLFMTLAPSAKITITIDATPLSVSPTIQGSTNATAATQADHVLTGVVTRHGHSTSSGNSDRNARRRRRWRPRSLLFTTNATRRISLHATDGQRSSAQVQTQDQSATFGPARTHLSSASALRIRRRPARQCGRRTPYNSTAPYVEPRRLEQLANVASGTLTLWQGDPCPNPLLCPGINISVTNETRATGGADAKQVTAASSTDVANWTAQITQIEATLTSQLQTELQAHAAGKPFAKDPAGNGALTVFKTSPTSFPPAAGAQFTAAMITVTGSSEAAIYDPVAVRNDVIADLDKLVKPGDVLASGSLTTPPCEVTQSNVNGTVVLACSATASASRTVNLDTLKAQLTGRNPGNAQKIIDSNVEKVQSVTVSEWPFKLFYLPLARVTDRYRRELRRDRNQVAVSATGDGTGHRRVLGIDVGSVRVGLAISDETYTLATPVATVPNESRTLWARIAREMEDRDVDRVVVGLPRRLDGSEGEAAEQRTAIRGRACTADRHADRALG